MSEPDATHGSHVTAEIPDAHGMSHAVEGPHGSAADHGERGHGHDDHAHVSEPLGPIDWPMWGIGVLGVALALVVTAGFVLATGFSFGA